MNDYVSNASAIKQTGLVLKSATENALDMKPDAPSVAF